MNTDKISSLIVQVIHKTVKGSIDWDVSEPPRYFEDGVEDIIPLIYTTSYKGKKLAVFLRRFKYFTDEDEFHWSEKVVLHF
jgi:hypothetical protein